LLWLSLAAEKSEVDKCVDATLEAKMNEAKLGCDSDCKKMDVLEYLRPIHLSDASKECLRAAAGKD